MSAVAASLLPKPFHAFLRKFNGPRLQRWIFGAWTVAVFAFLYVPILLLIVFSFNDSKLGLAWTGFTTRWYSELFGNAVLIGAFKNSMIVASATTVLATVLGTIGAWLMFRYQFPFRQAMGLLIFVPMVIPEVLMGVSLMILFNNLLHFDLGFATLIIGHTTFCFPFVLVGVQARLQGIDPFLEEAAMDLGATPIQAFWKVIVPYLMPAIVAGALMSFTLSFDEYIVTVFTSGPGSQTLPLQVYGLARKGLDPQLNALSALFVLGTIILVLFSELIKKRT
jgi:spermidine/putrescine transport system permease protein